MNVKVYKNLRNGLWSVVPTDGPLKGKVIGHAESLCLLNVRPRISEAGRLRVIREGRKNVHAYLEGRLVGVAGWRAYKGRTEPCPGQFTAHFCRPGKHAVRLSYNPYKGPHFVWTDTREHFRGATEVILNQAGAYAA